MKTLLLAVALLALAACEREGPAEKAGRSIDKAAKNVRDAVTPEKK
jgi:predicted small lipoprotein YifL